MSNERGPREWSIRNAGTAWSRVRLIATTLFAFGLMVASSLAADVRASLSRDVTVPGEPVRLEVRIEGGRPSAPPRDINVDGLNVSYMGTSQSSQVTFGNGGLRSINEIIYSYRVTPDRAGTFTIPALEVEVDGRSYKTQPVALRVQNDRGGGGRGENAGGGDAITRVGFAEIVLPKKTAYVGETIPVEVRLYVDSRIRWQPETMPTLEGEGFTKTKMPEPRQEKARRDGNEYDVLVFQTAITPSRAGKVKIGPSELPFQAQIPRAQPNRRRSPFDSFFGEDFFNDPFFGGFGAVERRVAKAQAVEVDVKPLPVNGRPASFSGAVGDFSVSAEGTPKSVKVGDPLTMTVSVTGRGNFDRMGAPVLVDKTGWRTYPPSNNFKPEDDIGLRGTKTFQVAVIPETKKTEMPRFEFSYFDPTAEKYVTKTTEPAPLTVEGAAPPAPSPVPTRPVPAEPAPQPSAPEPGTDTPLTDILGIRYDTGKPRSFVPIYEKREFWFAQIIPAAVLLGLGAMRIFRSSGQARAVSALRREKNAQIARLQRETGRAEFLDAAARAIQLDTALATGQKPGAVDAIAACRSRQLDPGTIEAVQQIFDARAELLYAGNGHSSEPLSAIERDRVLATISQFEKSHGRN